MFTSAIHAAALHNPAMNIRLFLGGLRPPKPSQGPGPGCAGLRPASAEVWRNPVSPHPSPRAYVHLSRPCGCAAQRRDEQTVVPGRAQPSQTLPRAGVWGNLVSPFPCLRVKPARGRVVGEPGFPTTLPRAGAWGNPVSPPPRREPIFTLALRAAAPHNAAMNRRLFLGGRSPPRPSRGRGYGGTWFPHVHVRGPSAPRECWPGCPGDRPR